MAGRRRSRRDDRTYRNVPQSAYQCEGTQRRFGAERDPPLCLDAILGTEARCSGGPRRRRWHHQRPPRALPSHQHRGPPWKAHCRAPPWTLGPRPTPPLSGALSVNESAFCSNRPCSSCHSRGPSRAPSRSCFERQSDGEPLEVAGLRGPAPERLRLLRDVRDRPNTTARRRRCPPQTHRRQLAGPAATGSACSVTARCSRSAWC